MSLSNILIPNPYNLYSNSLSMNLNQSQPVAGNNTLWLNSSNNHLYRDGVDLEGNASGSTVFIQGSDLYIPSSIFSVGLDSNNMKYLQGVFNAGSIEYLPMNPMIGPIATNQKLSSFSLIYGISGSDFNSITMSLSLVQYSNAELPTVSNIPITGTITLVPDGIPRIAIFTVTNPVTLAANQTLSILITMDGVSGSEIDIYGCFCNFST